APKVELKLLQSHLKYVYLGENNTLPVIISNKLTRLQKERVVKEPRDRKRVVSQTICNIQSNSFSIYMHKILLEEGSKANFEPQRILNSQK
ncbi:conserved hypothetical protein, partial [Ricinus communis]